MAFIHTGASLFLCNVNVGFTFYLSALSKRRFYNIRRLGGLSKKVDGFCSWIPDNVGTGFFCLGTRTKNQCGNHDVVSYLSSRPVSMIICSKHKMTFIAAISEMVFYLCHLNLIALNRRSLLSENGTGATKMWRILGRVLASVFKFLKYEDRLKHWLQKLANIFTVRKRSLGQGNVFTPVCHSVHGRGGASKDGLHPREGVCCLGGGLHWRGGLHPRGSASPLPEHYGIW